MSQWAKLEFFGLSRTFGKEMSQVLAATGGLDAAVNSGRCDRERLARCIGPCGVRKDLISYSSPSVPRIIP